MTLQWNDASIFGDSYVQVDFWISNNSDTALWYANLSASYYYIAADGSRHTGTLGIGGGIHPVGAHGTARETVVSSLLKRSVAVTPSLGFVGGSGEIVSADQTQQWPITLTQ